jgi:hypothetical protein
VKVKKRKITSVGQPLLTPDGKALSNLRVSFVLVDANSRPIDVFDSQTGEHICGRVEVLTDSNGEFEVELFPTTYANVQCYYFVHIHSNYISDFKSTLLAGAGSISFYLFRTTGLEASEVEVSQIQAYLDSFLDTLIADSATSSTSTWSSQKIVDTLALIETGGTGLSAYEIAVNNGFSGTEQQWLASLVGAQGIQGLKGNTGDSGTGGTGLDVNDIGYDIIMIAGQSNAVGWEASIDFNYDYTDPRILQFPNGGAYDQKIILAANPLKHNTVDNRNDSVGFGLGFAKLYLETLPLNRKIIIVPCAYGGTGYSDSKWRVGDSYYNNAVAKVNAVISLNSNNRIAAILWHQGEADCFTNMTGANYQIYLDAMIAGFRNTITGASDCPFILGGMVPEWSTGTHLQIRSVHSDTPNRNYYCAFTEGPSNANNGIHYTASGQRLMSTLMYSAYQQALINIPATTIPSQVISLVSTSTTNSSVSLSWAPSLGSTNYLVEYKLASEPSTWSVFNHAASSSSSIIVTGLTQDASYNFRVSGVNAAGTGIASTTITATAETVIIPLTGIGNISGTAQIGLQLTAGALTPSGATASYQWKICDTVGGTYTNINGATSNQYTLISGDLGKYIKVVATGTGSYSGVVTSTSTSQVTTIPLTPITAIGNISGLTQVNSQLTAGALTPSNATVSYQWQISNTAGGTYIDISGATSNTYTPVIGDLGKYIKIVATGTGSYTGTVASNATSAIVEEGTILPTPYWNIKSSIGVTVDGSNKISAVADQSGNSRNLTEAFTVAQPILVNFGLLTVIQFEKALSRLTGTFPTGTSYTKNLLVYFDDLVGSGNLMSSNTFTGASALWRASSNNAYINAGHTGPYTQANANGHALVAGNWYMITAMYNNTSGELTLYSKGVNIATANSVPAATATGIQINRFENLEDSGNNMKLLEAGVWNQTLTSQQLINEALRLETLYNITIHA